MLVTAIVLAFLADTMRRLEGPLPVTYCICNGLCSLRNIHSRSSVSDHRALLAILCFSALPARSLDIGEPGAMVVPLRVPVGSTSTIVATGTTPHAATTVLIVPICAKRFVGTIAGKRRYSTATIEGPMLCPSTVAMLSSRVLHPDLAANYACTAAPIPLTSCSLGLLL